VFCWDPKKSVSASVSVCGTRLDRPRGRGRPRIGDQGAVYQDEGGKGGKHRSTMRTEHRLEAYGTLRRRVVTAGAWR
jgi:hypothetical protein